MSELRVEVPVSLKLKDNAVSGLQDTLGKTVFEIKLKLGKEAVASIQREIQQAIGAAAKGAQSGGSRSAGSGGFGIGFNVAAAQSNINRIASAMRTMQNNTQKIFGTMVTGERAGYQASIDAMNTQVEAARNAISQINSEINAGGRASAESVQRYAEAYRAAGTYAREASGFIREYNSAQKLTADPTTGKSLENQAAALQKVRKALQEIDWMHGAYSRAFTNPEWSAKVGGIEQRLRELNIKGTLDEQDIGYVNGAVKSLTLLKGEARAAGEAGKTMGQRFSEAFNKFGNWFSVSQFFMSLVNSMRDMVVQVKEIDKALTDVRKVTDESDYKYDQYLERSIQRSKDLSAETADYIQSTANWARMGYDIDEARELGELSTIYYNVGDEVESVDDATSSLISTMKAFRIETDDVSTILDRLNYVGNNFGITSGGLGEVLQRSAASMNAANTSLNETIALGTAGNEILNNPEKVGNGLKTLSMRLRGSTAELEEAGETVDEYASSTSKMQAAVKALTGVDIMKSATEYKSVYTILDEISQVYGELTGVSQAALTEMLFGKQQSNLGEAILSNFETARNVFNELEGGMAEGSAMKEYSTYLDSIEGAEKRMAASFDELSLTMFDPDVLKAAYNTLSDILGVINNIVSIGTLPTLGGVLGAVLWGKNSSMSPFQRVQNADGTTSITSWLGASRARQDEYRKIFEEDRALLAQYEKASLNERELIQKTISQPTRDVTVFADLAAGGQKAADALKNVTNAQNNFIASLSVKGQMKSFGKSLLGLAKNIGVAAGQWLLFEAATMAVQGIGDWFYKQIHAEELAVERGAEMAEKWRESLEKTAQIKELTTGETAERFSELYAGIDSGTGKNLSLAADEYKEYHDLANQLAASFPSLVKYWDAEGNAVLDFSDNVDSVISKLKELQAEQENIARRERMQEALGNVNDVLAEAFGADSGKAIRASKGHYYYDTLFSSGADANVPGIGGMSGHERLAEAALYALGMSDMNLPYFGYTDDDYAIIEDRNTYEQPFRDFIKYYGEFLGEQLQEYGLAVKNSDGSFFAPGSMYEVQEAVREKSGELLRAFVNELEAADVEAEQSVSTLRQFIRDSLGDAFYERSTLYKGEADGYDFTTAQQNLAYGLLNDLFPIDRLGTLTLPDIINETGEIVDFLIEANKGGEDIFGLLEEREKLLGKIDSKTFAQEDLTRFGKNYAAIQSVIDSYGDMAGAASLQSALIGQNDEYWPAAQEILRQESTAEAQVEAVQETVKAFEELQEEYTKYDEARTNAWSALSSLNEKGYMTPEEWESVEAAGLGGAVAETGYGAESHMDYETARILERNKAAEMAADAMALYRQKVEELADAEEALNRARQDGKDLTAYENNVQALTQEANAAYRLAAGIQESASAMNAFRRAMESAELDDNFKEAQTALDEIENALETGKFGTNRFQASVELIGGEQLLADFRRGLVSEEDLAGVVETLRGYTTDEGELDRAALFDTLVQARQGEYFEGDDGEKRFRFLEDATLESIGDALGGVGPEMTSIILDAVNAYARNPEEVLGPQEYRDAYEERAEQYRDANISAQSMTANAGVVNVNGPVNAGEGGGESEKSSSGSDSDSGGSSDERTTNVVVEARVDAVTSEAREAVEAVAEEAVQPATKPVSADTSEAVQSVSALTAIAVAPVTKPVLANTSGAVAAANSLHANLARPVTKTVNIRPVGPAGISLGGWGNPLPGGPSAAGGGVMSRSGKALVGEVEPEIIVSRKTGTWSLARGPQLADVGRGDIVFNGEETQKILSGRTDLKQGGRSYAGGKFVISENWNKYMEQKTAASAQGPLPFGARPTNNSQTVPPDPPPKKKGSGGGGGSSGGGSVGSSEPESLVRDLYDWIERAVEAARKATQRLIDAVAEKVGYINKNKTLDEALEATAKEIDTNQKGYERYMQHITSLQQRYGFGDDMLERAKNGEINIADYEGDLKNQVEDFVMWVDKAQECLETVEELKQQETELARQKLDNIDEYYTHKIDRLEARLDKNGAELDNKAAAGEEIAAQDYLDAVTATQEKIAALQEERQAYAKQFDELVASGVLEPDSDAWHEYIGALEEMDENIISTETDLIGLKDEMAQIPLTNLQYALDRLNALQERIEGFQSFHEAQGAEETESTYADLIRNGFEQIENLEQQNQYLASQQDGLDILSEKWQKLQGQIDENNAAIWDIKTSQEGWNDAIADLRIDQLEKQRDELEKTNEELERQKEMEDALEELERAKSQRTKLIYREGVGFVYEADPDKIQEAQDRLDDLRHQENMNKLDQIIEAIEENKKTDNVYNYEGNEVLKQFTDTVSSQLYGLLAEDADISKLFANTVGNSAAQNAEMLAGEAKMKEAVSLSIGDIYLNGVNDVDAFAQSIVNELPNRLLQRLYQ